MHSIIKSSYFIVILFKLRFYTNIIIIRHRVTMHRVAKCPRRCLELSLPGRQSRFCGRQPSSFYFVKKTKTTARTSRTIYTACCRVRLRAKSCLSQEMRRARIVSSLFSLRRFLRFPPFLCQDRTRYSRIAKCY